MDARSEPQTLAAGAMTIRLWETESLSTRAGGFEGGVVCNPGIGVLVLVAAPGVAARHI